MQAPQKHMPVAKLSMLSAFGFEDLTGRTVHFDLAGIVADQHGHLVLDAAVSSSTSASMALPFVFCSATPIAWARVV